MPIKKHRRPRQNKQQNRRELNVKIERIVPNGVGIGFADGLTIFVPLVAAGDLARVAIDEQKGKIAFASIIEILESSADRATPLCPYFGRCGGCDFQHLNYPAQLAAKIEIIKDCLRRIGKIEWTRDIEIVASPAEWNYRTRVQWKLERGKIGYFERNSHRVIDVEVCPILAPPLQEELNRRRETPLQNDGFSETKVVSSGAEISVAANKQTIDDDENFYAANQTAAEQNRAAPAAPAAASKILEIKINDFIYKFSADVFFQVNHALLPIFIATAIGNSQNGVALDLYGGVGLFALPLTQKFGQVISVEGSSASSELARVNAATNNVRVFPVNSMVGEWLSNKLLAENPPDFVLLDPPRTGAERETIESLITIAPAEIVYVSCNPATLARDLRILLAAQKYEIAEITAFDFFPQTHHVETIVRLKKL